MNGPMARKVWWALLLLGIGGLSWFVHWLLATPLSYRPAPLPPLASATSMDAGVLDDEAEAAPVILVDAGPDAPPELREAIPPVRTQAQRTPSFQDTTNYLLIGTDPTHSLVGRADSIMVAVFDDDTRHVGVVSIPRDLYVSIPDHGPARINAMTRLARRMERDPIELSRRVVSDTLAMPIHHVVIADLAAFEQTIDALGGVEVNVRCPILDNFIDPRTESGRRVLDVPEGRVRMDGPTAAMYVRSRHGRSDWDRARRQQAVLLGLRDRVREMSATRWVPVLGDALESGVVSSMSRLEMIGLARRVSHLAPERIHGMVLGHKTTESHRTPENRWVLLPDFDAIDEALEELFAAPVPRIAPAAQAVPAEGGGGGSRLRRAQGSG